MPKSTVNQQAVLVRFWSKVDKGPDCWTWLGSKISDGYGVFWYEGQNRRAHRWLYEREIAEVPANLSLDHICRNRLCVRPAHLRVVTNKENVLCGEGLAAKNARKTHCKRGHEFSAANTLITKSGTRSCRACMREHMRKFRSNRRKHA